MKTITTFTDGAAKGNPGPGGYGGVIVYPDRVLELGGGEERTTNNAMELQAVIEVLRIVADEGVPVTIYTDSRYVVEGATGWIFNWVKNGWKTKGNDDVSNKALWEALLPLLTTVDITWHKIPGHVDLIGNERADRIASAYGEGKNPELYDGPKESYGHDIDDVSYDEEKAKARSHMRARQREKAYSYVSKVDGKIEVHKTWAECEKRVKGVSAKFKKALNSDEEQAIIAEFS